jgi:hypothetical protein
MRLQPTFLLLALVLAPAATPARAEGRWCLSLGAGESVSQRHGSALDAALYAQVDPLLGIGVETGFAYMNVDMREPSWIAYPVESDGGPGSTLGSLTDGITRNRGYYLGPAVKVGDTVYAVASTGLYDFSDNAGGSLGTRWGASAGFGLSGRGRFEPRAEVRYRWVPDASLGASAYVFTLGFHIR